MYEHSDVVIIGAGQAGLSISYLLTKMHKQHIILEQADSVVPAWRQRWDSFTLVLPNWTLQIPGNIYQGNDPNGFMDKAEVVKYFEDYAAAFEPEIRYGHKVTAVESNPFGENYLIRVNGSSIEADNVVIAAGTFQEPKIPPFSKKISDSVTQVHTNDYRNPESLPDGAVLVVGTGQSGCQIAEELYLSGRKVYLCVSGAKPIPRFYRGKDIIWWLQAINFFEQPVDDLPSPRSRFDPNPYVSGKDGGHTLDLHQFARDGVKLLGKMKAADGIKITFEPDLMENLKSGDEFIEELTGKIDGFIDERQMQVDEASNGVPLRDGYQAEVISELDLSAEGINSIIWATGYNFDFSWIDFPLLDQDGYPIQERGVSAYPGLYFLGLHWMEKRKSGILLGVGEDAEHIAKHIATRIQ